MYALCPQWNGWKSFLNRPNQTGPPNLVMLKHFIYARLAFRNFVIGNFGTMCWHTMKIESIDSRCHTLYGIWCVMWQSRPLHLSNETFRNFNFLWVNQTHCAQICYRRLESEIRDDRYRIWWARQKPTDSIWLRNPIYSCVCVCVWWVVCIKRQHWKEKNIYSRASDAIISWIIRCLIASKWQYFMLSMLWTHLLPLARCKTIFFFLSTYLHVS